MNVPEVLEHQSEASQPEYEDHITDSSPVEAETETSDLATEDQTEEPALKEASGDEPDTGSDEGLTEEGKAVEDESEGPNYRIKSYIYDIPEELIDFDPRWPIDEELQGSIEEVDILVPLDITSNGNGRFRIVDGKRRYMGRRQDCKTVPCKFVDGEDPLLMMLLVNSLRRDMNKIDFAEGLQQIKDSERHRSRDLCKIFGLAESTMSEILSLNRLDEEIKQKVREGKVKITRKALIGIVKVGDSEDQKREFNSFVEDEFKFELREAEATVNSSNEQETPQPESPSKFTRFKEKVETWTKRIKNIEPADYENNRDVLKSTLESLSVAIQEKLNSLSPAELRPDEVSQESTTAPNNESNDKAA